MSAITPTGGRKVDKGLDRGMPRDGVINLRSVRTVVQATGYNGHIEIEIFSAQNW